MQNSNRILANVNLRYTGVSKNSGTPKRMVYKENPIKIDDLGVPLFLETPIHVRSWYFHIVMSSAKFKSSETTIVVSIFCWGRTPKNPGSPILIMIS